MGATKDQGVDLGIDQWLKILTRDLGDLGSARLAAFDEFGQKWASNRSDLKMWRCREGVKVGARFDRRDSSDHADLSTSRRRDCAANSRLDHFDDGKVISLSRIPEHRGACRVTGDHERFDTLVDESIQEFQGEGADLCKWARTVGCSRSIAEVEDRFIGELIDHGSGDGEAADPRIEDADRDESGGWHGDKGTARAITWIGSST